MQDESNIRVLDRAEALAEQCYAVAATLPSYERFGLRSQLRRASVSIAANIAEGVGRGNNGDLERFLRIAAGSLAELKTLLRIASRVHGAASSRLQEAVESSVAVGRMLNRFIATVSDARTRPSRDSAAYGRKPKAES